MKNAVKLFFFAAFLFIPAAVFAQGSGSTGGDPGPARQPSNAGIADESNLIVTRTVAGKIVGITEGILTIKTQKGKEVQIALVKRTKFKIGKKTVDSSELDVALFNEGNEVKITYLPSENSKVDKVAVEVRFVEDKEKAKPVLG